MGEHHLTRIISNVGLPQMHQSSLSHPDSNQQRGQDAQKLKADAGLGLDNELLNYQQSPILNDEILDNDMNKGMGNFMH